MGEGQKRPRSECIYILPVRSLVINLIQVYPELHTANGDNAVAQVHVANWPFVQQFSNSAACCLNIVTFVLPKKYFIDLSAGKTAVTHISDIHVCSAYAAFVWLCCVYTTAWHWVKN